MPLQRWFFRNQRFPVQVYSSLCQKPGLHRTRADTLREIVEEVTAPEGWVLIADILGEDSEYPWLRLCLARPAGQELLRAVSLKEHSRDVSECARRWARAIGLPEDVYPGLSAERGSLPEEPNRSGNIL